MLDAPAPPRTRGAALPSPTTPGPTLPGGWRGVALTVGLFVGTAVALLLFITVAERWWYRGRVLPSVNVHSVSVAGKSEADTRAALGQIAPAVASTPIQGRAGDKTLTLNPADVDTKLDVDSTLRAARRAGRSTNPVDAMLGTVLRRFRPEQVTLRVTHNDQKLGNAVSTWVDQASNGRANADVRIVGTTVTVVPPQSGVGINPARTRRAILTVLPTPATRTFTLASGKATPDISLAEAEAAATRVRAILAQPVTMTVANTPLVLQPTSIAPTIAVTPKNQKLAISVDPVKLRTAFGTQLAPFERPPVDARFEVTGTAVSVVPSQPGALVDLDPVAAAIADGQHAVTASPKDAQPAHSTEWAQKLNITQQVSTFTTNHPAGQERVKNIHRAADVVNNTIVEPGQSFSLNDKLGRRTAESGYVKAPVYNQGDFQEDFGGGVSQFTTTLYNATFFGGYKDIEHAPHSIYISRYPMGREATLNWGSIDMKFQNDSNAGILIRTSYSGSSITVTLYSTNDGRSVKAEGPNVLEQTEAEVEYVDDPALAPGVEKEVQAGHPRIVVENFRIISRPGQPDKRERYVWTYEMMKRKVARRGGANPPPPAAAAAGTPTTTKPR